MLTEMAKIEIIGHRRHLDAVLSVLERLALVEILEVAPDATGLTRVAADPARLAELQYLRHARTRIDGLLELLPDDPPGRPWAGNAAALHAELEELAPWAEELIARVDDLTAEQAALPRYIEALERLAPLLPSMIELAGYETTALLIERRHAPVVAALRLELEELIGDHFELFSGSADGDTVGAVVVFPRSASAEVHALLGRRQVSRVRLPERFEQLTFRESLAAMRRRIEELPAEIEQARAGLHELLGPRAGWVAARRVIDGQVRCLDVMGKLGATQRTFVVSGWVPRSEIGTIGNELSETVGPEVLVHETPVESDDQPPVMLHNPRFAAPFEFLVQLLDLPRSGTIDPTVLMALFMPLFFGMMLGDIVYGLALVGIATWARRRWGRRSRNVRDLLRVVQIGAWWAVVWGVIYGELLGGLGHQFFGLEPIWINREEAIAPLLLFALAIGAAQIVLGLILGIWNALRARQKNRLVERSAQLAALIGLFLLVGTVAGRLPAGFMTPGLAVVIVALAVLIVMHGALGLLLGPLELIGTLGNVLSYLRIAAIGVASVYLARVANELGALGPLWLGLIIAALLHVLNLALGTFSPTIQALRLHYVEFFGKFLEEGGRPFQPFGGDEAEPPAERERQAA